MKQFLCTWILILPVLVLAQGEDTEGIKWITGLSWDQIKQKAQQEHKYIFVDAYTTWCGPCKMMDNTVYPNDTVGDFFNKHFISVKAQMDQTENDEKDIRDWYNDANTIKGKYMVEAYPSLIFLTPRGEMIHKEEGYKSVQKIISVGNLVLTPGKVYNDPYIEYKTLVDEYKQGIKCYEKMAYMINTAMKLKDIDLVKKLADEHRNYYLADSNRELRYTKENIQLWASYSLTSKSRLFQLFSKNRDTIDKIMGRTGYATNVVSRTIQTEVVDSFFRMQRDETITVTGKKIPNSEIMFMRLPQRQDGRIEPDYVEADWKKLRKMIRNKFANEDTERNLLKARIRWYQQHQNMETAIKMKLIELDKYPPVNIEVVADEINNDMGWPAFLYVTNKGLLKKTTKWMAKVIEKRPTSDVLLDTYANLLHKLGRTEDGIRWEEKALSVVNPSDKGQKETYRSVIAQMKKGEPTYLKDGAIWVRTCLNASIEANR